MGESKQGWIDARECIPNKNKNGIFLVWDDTNYIWRLCHFYDDCWHEVRTGDVFPLRHTYYKELDIPEQVHPKGAK